MAILRPPSSKQRIMTAATLVVVVGVPVLVPKLLELINWSATAQAVGSVATFAGLASAWISKQVHIGSKLVGRAELAFSQLKQIRDDRLLKETSLERGELQKLKEQEAAALRGVGDAEARVQVLERELAEMKPGERMQKFIRERSASVDYRQHLGLVSLIRKDFETLSELRCCGRS
jgi:hypothetical protein